MSGFAPADPRVAAAWRRNPHWRITRSGAVFEALVPAVIEQKVTGHEAWRGWRLLLRRFGSTGARARVPGEGCARCPARRRSP